MSVNIAEYFAFKWIVVSILLRIWEVPDKILGQVAGYPVGVFPCFLLDLFRHAGIVSLH